MGGSRIARSAQELRDGLAQARQLYDALLQLAQEAQTNASPTTDWKALREIYLAVEREEIPSALHQIKAGVDRFRDPTELERHQSHLQELLAQLDSWTQVFAQV